MSNYVVVADPLVGGVLQRDSSGFFPQYVLVVDERPEPITVMRQTGPGGVAVILPTGRRGPQGDQGVPGLSAYGLAVQLGYQGTEQQWIDGIRGFYFADSPTDEPPPGTPDRTFVFERV